MNVAMVLSTALFLVGAVARAQPPSAGAPTTPAAVADELGDRIDNMPVAVNQGSVEAGRARAVIAAPIDAVYQIVTDYGRYPEFLPNFRQSRVLSRRGSNALVYMQATIARNTTTLWAQLRIFARRPRGTTRIIEARMIEGNMEQFYARWELTPVDDRRTIVQFDLLVDPDLPLPSSLFTDENVKASRRTLRALRERTATP